MPLLLQKNCVKPSTTVIHPVIAPPAVLLRPLIEEEGHLELGFIPVLDQYLSETASNRQRGPLFFSFLEQLQICKIHLGRLQFMIELDRAG